jgi:signal transduction histidine kinase
VIRNLIDNAIRHAPATTVVRIRVGGGGAMAIVRVSDDGAGFAPDLCGHAFDAFTRGDPARDVRTGTAGLGLAIAQAIVVAHHGTIAIVDESGGVVEFSIPRLPR